MTTNLTAEDIVKRIRVSKIEIETKKPWIKDVEFEEVMALESRDLQMDGIPRD